MYPFGKPEFVECILYKRANNKIIENETKLWEQFSHSFGQLLNKFGDSCDSPTEMILKRISSQSRVPLTNLNKYIGEANQILKEIDNLPPLRKKFLMKRKENGMLNRKSKNVENRFNSKSNELKSLKERSTSMEKITRAENELKEASDKLDSISEIAKRSDKNMQYVIDEYQKTIVFLLSSILTKVIYLKSEVDISFIEFGRDIEKLSQEIPDNYGETSDYDQNLLDEMESIKQYIPI